MQLLHNGHINTSICRTQRLKTHESRQVPGLNHYKHMLMQSFSSKFAAGGRRGGEGCRNQDRLLHLSAEKAAAVQLEKCVYKLIEGSTDACGLFLPAIRALRSPLLSIRLVPNKTPAITCQRPNPTPTLILPFTAGFDKFTRSG